MNPEQLVHVFPYDSFTYYHPFERDNKATDRINVLMTPEELVTDTFWHNEILLLEEGSISTDFDFRIPQLKRIALYCVDEIRKQDIDVAKKEGVGIILVNTKFEKEKERIGRIDFSKDVYFTSRGHIEEFEKNRR